ncbi:MAG: hypothetical protein IT441_06690 [Phycisphaeraceae bacterium]|nr:hypothetical protein [Phycisphaeraceae bacterium]
MNLSRLPRRLLVHHLPIAVLTVAACWIVSRFLLDSPDAKFRWSMGTAYVATAEMAFVLSIGTWNLLRGRTNPVSSDFRRDLAIWAGLTCLVHVAVGWQVHMGHMWLYFFKAREGAEAWTLRDDLFGWANYVGLAAGMIALVLLVTSNDVSIRSLGRGVWKNLQRTAYLLILLTFAHGLMFQVIEKREWAWIAVLSVMLGWILAAQSAGVTARRAKTT